VAYQDALAALADPTRRAVFERINDGPNSVGDLADDLPVSRPAVSQHLRVLKDAGLVTAHREGNRNVYSIDPTGVEQLRAYVDRFWTTALDRYQKAAEKRGRRS
jgi:DNA-binding transcriptional ArsR family regulator